MNKEIGIGILLTVAIAGGLAYWYYGPWPAQPIQSEGREPLAVTAPPDEPIQYPAPATTAQSEPLPPLAASDEVFGKALDQLFGAAPVATYLVPKNFIARLVATLDSLDKEPVPLRTHVLRPVAELPIVDTAGDTFFLSSENSKRYRPLMEVLQPVDGKTIGELYLHYYPLFQQAYVDLGFPNGYFNDRLVKIIDHLLVTPEIDGPIELVRPKVLYHFADPDLERRSSGQKLLLRVGTENSRAIKVKLREIRSVISAQGAPRAGQSNP